MKFLTKLRVNLICILVGIDIINKVSKESNPLETFEIHTGKKMFWGIQLTYYISEIISIPFNILVKLLLKVLTK